MSSHTDCINKHFEQFQAEMPVYLGRFVIFSFPVYIMEMYRGYSM